MAKISELVLLDGSVVDLDADRIEIMDASETAGTDARNKYTTVRELMSALCRSFTVATLPDAGLYPVGWQLFASDGLKAGETIGTGVPVWSDGTYWRTFYDNSIVAD